MKDNTKLKSIDVEDTKISSIDISRNHMITILNCINTLIKEINAELNPSLNKYGVKSNSDVTVVFKENTQKLGKYLYDIAFLMWRVGMIDRALA